MELLFFLYIVVVKSLNVVIIKNKLNPKFWSNYMD